MKAVSDPIERERLLRVAIGKVINGRNGGVLYKFIPPTMKRKQKGCVTYISRHQQHYGVVTNG